VRPPAAEQARRPDIYGHKSGHDRDLEEVRVTAK
jgi:hypothetical protein